MKLSQLLKELQAVMVKYGDLDVDISIATPSQSGGYEAIRSGPLDIVEVEERSTLNLISEHEEDWGQNKEGRYKMEQALNYEDLLKTKPKLLSEEDFRRIEKEVEQLALNHLPDLLYEIEILRIMHQATREFLEAPPGPEVEKAYLALCRVFGVEPR